MRRGMQGKLVKCSIISESYNAFIPNDLPPTPEIDTIAISSLLEKANQAIGALNGVISVDQWALVCWDYIVLNLEATGEAPIVYPGFNEISYVDKTLIPNVRIGLEQMCELVDANNTLEVSLRGAEVVTAGADRIGLIEDETDAAGNPFMTYIYLTDTDDPGMKEWLAPVSDPDDPLATPSFDQYSLPVGEIVSLYAEPYELGQYESSMRFYFDLKGSLAQAMHLSEEKYHDFVFKPREGYTYTFTIHFKEIFDDQSTKSNACFGIQNLKFIVVPKYLVWTDQEQGAGKIGNWNNDDNWRRVTDKDELKKEDDSFLEENTNGKGYVPMLFSKVIMPRNSKVELYAAGLRNNIWETELPQYSHIGSATENIEYDLMVFEENSAYTTKPYRVALCDQIHFEPGAEMLRAEYLLYDKAWVDYELEGGRWYTLASPLQGVVAGDFYTDKDWFGKVPHILRNGKICIFGNIELHLNELIEENSLESIVSKYIPWLFRLPLELKLLEFLFEIEYYLGSYLGYDTKEGKIKNNLNQTKIKISTVEQLWETIEEIENYSTYEIYIKSYEDYSIFLRKEKNIIYYERDAYKKARQRITGKSCNNLIGKTAFIGVGSVNSYIIKYGLANGLNDIVLIDHDKYTVDNAFRFAFPYKGKKKIYAAKEFCKNLDLVNLRLFNLNIRADSNADIINGCKRIIVSVDNFMSWIQIASFLEKNCSKDVEIILAAINNFGENAKFVKTKSRQIINTTYDFLFKSKITERRELVGNGCGRSIAIYDEELLIKLAKKVIKSLVEIINEDEIVYVEIEED